MIDAIYYPSVANNLNTENLAIKPSVFDEVYEPFGVVENLITSDLSGGKIAYHMETKGATRKFNLITGEILWDEDDSDEAFFEIQENR